MEKVGYCPICQKTFIFNTTAAMAKCPQCGHHIAVHEKRE